MKRIARSCVCIILCLVTLLASGCGVPFWIVRMKEQGCFPDASDFPNTAWKCREIDLTFNMLDNGESIFLGTYTVNGNTYRAVGGSFYDEFGFDLYNDSDADFTSSEYRSGTEAFVRAHHLYNWGIHVTYLYEDETIKMTVTGGLPPEGEQIPSVLTFENVGLIAQIPGERLYAKEIDMYLDSFEDIDDYYKGEITLDGKKCIVQAIEIGNNDYYAITIENGIVNNYKFGTTSTLIYMKFESTENGILARITDEYLRYNGNACPDWKYAGYDGAVVTFEKETND